MLLYRKKTSLGIQVLLFNLMANLLSFIPCIIGFIEMFLENLIAYLNEIEKQKIISLIFNSVNLINLSHVPKLHTVYVFILWGLYPSTMSSLPMSMIDI